MSELMIPFREQAIDAEAASKLFGLSRARFLRNIACQRTFPERVNMKPATWIVGEVLDWREANRASRRNYAKAA